MCTCTATPEKRARAPKHDRHGRIPQASNHRLSTPLDLRITHPSQRPIELQQLVSRDHANSSTTLTTSASSSLIDNRDNNNHNSTSSITAQPAHSQDGESLLLLRHIHLSLSRCNPRLLPPLPQSLCNPRPLYRHHRPLLRPRNPTPHHNSLTPQTLKTTNRSPQTVTALTTWGEFGWGHTSVYT
jgi:hypothetical protein